MSARTSESYPGATLCLMLNSAIPDTSRMANQKHTTMPPIANASPTLVRPMNSHRGCKCSLRRPRSPTPCPCPCPCPLPTPSFAPTTTTGQEELRRQVAALWREPPPNTVVTAPHTIILVGMSAIETTLLFIHFAIFSAFGAVMGVRVCEVITNDQAQAQHDERNEDNAKQQPSKRDGPQAFAGQALPLAVAIHRRHPVAGPQLKEVNVVAPATHIGCDSVKLNLVSESIV